MGAWSGKVQSHEVAGLALGNFISAVGRLGHRQWQTTQTPSEAYLHKGPITHTKSRRRNVMGCSRGAYGYLVAIICLTVNVVVEAGQYTFTKIADSSGNLFVDLDQAASINNQGTVTFVGDKADGTIGIYTWSNGLITPVIDNSGPISAFKAPVINNNGLIAFRGTRKTGGDAIYTVTSDGVLTPVAEASGNLILQGTPALNDAGNVV